MLKKYYPYAYFKSVFDIDYKELFDKGIKGLIFDIDNTLVHHGDDATPEIEALFRKIHKIGLKTVLLSNNDDERVKRFIKNIDTPYVCDADKPHPSGYEKALKILDLDKANTVVIGDQIFVDIIGANNLHIPSILVHYIKVPGSKWPGFKRIIEMMILFIYKLDRRYNNRLFKNTKENTKMPKKQRKLFCEISPLTYAISVKKNVLTRHIKNILSKEKFAKKVNDTKLPHLISSCSSQLIKRGKGIDPVPQQNKAENIRIACSRINGLIIHPGETFSFWNRVGNTTARKGYKEGRVIIFGKLTTGLGGGLCNLANTIHRVVLESPLTDTEVHMHSDALAPDKDGIRIPMSAGTSVNYNYEDYRFKNNTDQNIQLISWCDEDNLYCEIRSTKSFPNTYSISEEDHHFTKEGDTYYRVSKIFKDTYDKKSGKLLKHDLIHDNHSEVLFDPDLIPSDLLR